jgi:hypothetical protein
MPMNSAALTRIASVGITLAIGGAALLQSGCSDDNASHAEHHGQSDAAQDAEQDASRPDDNVRDGGTNGEKPSERDAGDRTHVELTLDASDDDDDNGGGDNDRDASAATSEADAGDQGTGTPTNEPMPLTDGGLPDVEIPNGSVPSELVGVWQETRASSGDYTNEFGEDFSATSGFSAQLKITAEGKYYFVHFASGVSPSCAFVSQMDQSVGSAVLEGNTLTLTPTTRRLDTDNCTNSASTFVELDPLVFTVTLSEDRQFYGGMRSYKLGIEGYSIPLELSSLFREPSYAPVQPELPTSFMDVVDDPYQEFQGLWVAAAGTDANFYNPDTDEFYLPELNGSPHQWLRFNENTYEGAVALQNVNSEGVCKLDLIYYEKGTATLAITEDVGGQQTHFVGNTTFVSQDSRLIVTIRECDEDSGSYRYDLTPLTSYFRWIYFSPNNPPESFTLSCDYEQSEWQSLLCGNGIVGFSRRE